MKWRQLASAGVLTIGGMCVVLAACGGGDDDATESPAPDSDTAEDDRSGTAPHPDEPGDTELPAGSPDAENGSHDVPSAGIDTATCWSAPPSGGDGVGFEDVTADMGLVQPLTGMYGHTAAIADVNDDGWTDVFVAGFADREAEDYQVRGADGPSPDRLLLGGPDGFVVDESFPGELARTSGATFADLDADGDLDLVVVRNPRGDDDIGARATTVYERDDASWRAATTLAADVAGRSVAALDIDRDGLLDLAIAGDRFGAGPSRLYRNDGSLQFADATAAWGMPDDMDGLALAVVDLDGDSWSDIVVSGDDRVLMGGPDGFEIEREPALEWQLYGDEDDPAGIAVGDLDRDGRADLVIGQHFNSTIDDGTKVPVRLLLNRADGDGFELVDRTSESGLPDLWTKSPHVAIADIDNDGHSDIVTSAATDEGVPFVLRNTGDANTGDAEVRFEPVGDEGDGAYWVTGAVDDFDHDGRLDVLAIAWEPGTQSPLFRSVGAAGHWVEVDVGSMGAAAPAAVVSADLGDDEVVSWAQSTTGYAAGATTFVRFGLGDDPGDEIDLTVTAPNADTVQVAIPVDSRGSLASC